MSNPKIDGSVETEELQLAYITQKLKLSRGFHHNVQKLTSGDTTYIEGTDFELEKFKESGETYIFWKTPETGGVGNLTNTHFPQGGEFTDEEAFPVGDMPSRWLVNEAQADSVEVVNDGVSAGSTIGTSGGFPPWNITEYSNNFCITYVDVPISLDYLGPYSIEVKVKPAIVTGLVPITAVNYGLFCGEGLIMYGTPCDFIGIGGYGPGCVDACPAPAGTGGDMTQTNTFAGEGRIHSYSGSTIKVFRAVSELDETPINITAISEESNALITTASNHGYNVGDIVYIDNCTGGWSRYVVPTGPLFSPNETGFRITAVPSLDTFRIDLDTSVAGWNIIVPYGRVQKITSCTVDVWDSGIRFPTTEVIFKIVGRDLTFPPVDGEQTFEFFYNVTGNREKGWKKLGPTFDKPLGYNILRLLYGGYMGGFNMLSGATDTYISSNYDGTTRSTIWVESYAESVYYDTTIGIPTYTEIPVLDESSTR